MNKENPALDIYIDVARDVHVLGMFLVPQMAPWRNYGMQRGVWDSQVPSDVKARFIEAKYVVIQKFAVYLTEVAKEIVRYNPDKPDKETV